MTDQIDSTTADPVKDVVNDEVVKQGEEEVEEPKTDYKGKGKKKEEPVEEEEDDDDEDDEDDSDEDDDEDDEDDIPMDEVDLNAIIPPSSRRSARSGQIDYSSEEALKKAGLVSASGGGEGDGVASSNQQGVDEDEDDDFKGDETMDDDDE